MSFSPGANSHTCDRFEDVRNGAGKRIARRCIECTTVLRFFGSCWCGRDGYPAWCQACCEDHMKERDKRAAKARASRREEFKAAQGALPGVDMTPVTKPRTAPGHGR